MGSPGSGFRRRLPRNGPCPGCGLRIIEPGGPPKCARCTRLAKPPRVEPEHEPEPLGVPRTYVAAERLIERWMR